MAIFQAKTGILTLETRVLAFSEAEIRVKRADDGSKTIVGYAAKFDKLSQNLGGFVEKIDKKAFKNCLERCDVRGLRNHDPNQLLGRTKSGTMRLTSDDTGLKYEIDAPDTQTGRDTITEIERGDLDGSSFSFTVGDDQGDGTGDEWDDTTDPPTRTLLNVRDLFDVGPVTYPAYLDTEVNCRSLDRFKESRRLNQAAQEQAARDAASRVQRVRLLKLRLLLPTIERIGK